MVATAAVVMAAAIWVPVRRAVLRPSVPQPNAAAFEQAARVRILRDRFGVPHIFGKTDADAAFGLAYAHAEDDFPLIQGVVAASRGKLATLMLSQQALVNDYYVRLVDVPGEVERKYTTLPQDVIDLMESYARGLNHYAFKHPDQVDARLLPFVGPDVAAGFTHKIPLMANLPAVLQALDGPTALQVGDPVASLSEQQPRAFPASNSHAVAKAMATDGITRLNINSHQPWEGPVAWYEAHVVSEQGWNMTGGTFPGAPVILHGHNDFLGWAHTVNKPDIVDVYRLEMNPEHPDQYRFEGAWRALEITQAPIEIDTGLFNITVHKDVLHSVHGPVLQTRHGTYAVRYSGWDRRIRAVEQWYRMNKATNLEQWQAAMAIAAIPMFNTTYADKDNIFYVYNALIPVRGAAADYGSVLPGDRADLLWDTYLPFADLPQVLNPPSGFVQNCNATPFQTTTGEGNPNPADFPHNAGVETTVNNRTIRSLQLFGSGNKISPEDFVRFKFDRTYAPTSPMFTQVVGPLLASFSPQDQDQQQALEVLRAWDGVADEGSAGATLAILTGQPLFRELGKPDARPPSELFVEAVAWLKEHYDSVKVPLGTVQRLHRGTVDLALGGGPDVLNAAHTRKQDGKLVGFQGDSYVLVVAFGPQGPVSRSIHQYGSSSRPDSPHFADQAPLFVKRLLKPAWRKPEDIRANLEREYSP